MPSRSFWFSYIQSSGNIAVAMPRGGPRPNSGRPRGRRDSYQRHRPTERARKRVDEFLDIAKVERLTMPVEWLLRRLSDESLPPEYRDRLAAMAAPYVSPRLSAVAVTKRVSAMSDSEIAQWLDIAEEDLQRLENGQMRWLQKQH